MSSTDTHNSHSMMSKPNGSAGSTVQNGTATPSRPPNTNKGGGKARGKRLAEIHSQRLPVKLKALPTFIPHNPLSIFQILWAIVSEYVKPYDSHRLCKYRCTFSPSTRSVHVTDPATIRALWEQGFFGKGNLSRSEPNWLEAETKRLSSVGGNTAEEWTKKRRAERAAMKMERARIELQQIEEQKKIEQGIIGDGVAEPAGESSPAPTAESNDEAETDSRPTLDATEENQKEIFSAHSPSETAPKPDALATWVWNAARIPLDYVGTPSGSSIASDISHATSETIVETVVWNAARIPLNYGQSFDDIKEVGPEEEMPTQVTVDPKEALTIVDDAPILLEDAPIMQDEKSSHRDPDSEQVVSSLQDIVSASPDGNVESETVEALTAEAAAVGTATETELDAPASEERAKFNTEIPRAIFNQEHLQLSLEEAFFLQYSFGILDVAFPNSITEISKSNADLLRLFRQHCNFPPAPPNALLQPDDDFMLHYVVYHHFRSLGWVVRDGVKFAVDYLLYERGPAFKHAEFAIQIIPSYTHKYWFETVERRSKVKKTRQKHAWHWFHCVNRVQTQVTKTLVLCYVDVPPPGGDEMNSQQNCADIGKFLKSYKIREFCIRRWSANRNRG